MALLSKRILPVYVLALIPLVLSGFGYAQGCKYNYGPPATCTSSTGTCSPVDKGFPPGKCRVFGGEECECDGSGVQPPPPSYAVTVVPRSKCVFPGGPAIYNIGFAEVGGYSGQITLACSLGGRNMSCSVSPQTVASSGAARLTVTTSNGPNNALPGDYAIAISAVDQNGRGPSNSPSVDLLIDSPTYTLNISQFTPGTVRPGHSATSTIQLNPACGTVTSACSFGGKFMSCSVSPNPTSGTSTLTFNATDGTTNSLDGKYGINVTATDQTGLAPTNGPQTATVVVSSGGGFITVAAFAGLMTLWGFAVARSRTGARSV